MATYDEFVKKAQEAGVYGEFSQYDLDLAKQYPEFGLAITQNKLDYAAATTPEAKALANAAAEANRAKYGSYAGGVEGVLYLPITPASYQSQYQSGVNDALNTLANYGSFSYDQTAPTFSFNQTAPTFDSSAYTAPTYSGYSGEKPTYNFSESQPTYNFNQSAPTYSGYSGEKPTYNFSESQPTYSGYSGAKPTYNFNEAQPEYQGYNVAQPTWDGSGYAAPEYNNPYAQQQAELLDKVVNRGEFTWDESDPNWQAYKKQYRREGDRATAQALGQAAAATGGIPSSYAVTAASQAGDYYAAQLSDMLPTVYQQAYNRWLNELGLDQEALNAVNTQQQIDYQRYLTELGQYNTDRSFAYNDYVTNLNQWNANRSFDYNQYLTALDQFNANRAAAQNMYSLDLGQYNQDRNFDFNTYLAALDQFNADRNAAQNMYSLDLSQYNNDRNFDFNTYLAALDQFNADRNAAQNLYSMDLSQYNANRNAAQNMYLAALDQYNTDRSFDYNTYLTALDQFNNDRSFDFNSYLAAQDQYNADRSFAQNQYLAALDQYNTDRSFAYNDYLTQYDMAQNTLAALQNADNTAYGRYIDNLNYNTQLRQEAQAAQELAYNRAWNEAAIAADLGDYSKFNALGINTTNNPTEYQKRYNEAVLAAQYGDYSGLESLGVRPNYININDEALASGGEYTGNGSYLSSGQTGVGQLNDVQKRALQYKLGVTPDGDFGPVSMQAMFDAGYYDLNQAYDALVTQGQGTGTGTLNPNQIMALQYKLGVTPDGDFGSVSTNAMFNAGFYDMGQAYNALVLGNGVSGELSDGQIRALQSRLGVTADGDFGSVSTNAMNAAGYTNINDAYNALVANGAPMDYSGGGYYGDSDYSDGGDPAPSPTPSGPSDYEIAVQNFLANGAIKFSNSDETNIAILKRNGYSDVEAANEINKMQAVVNDERMKGANVGVTMTEKEIRAYLDKRI